MVGCDAANPYHPGASGAMVGTKFPTGSRQARDMAASLIPHFANDQGVEKIRVGVREFQCMGARPPHDHPHVFLDMGADGQILCPYCSALYVYDASLAADDSDPKGALVAADAVS
jgi:uncharacterized Zn-finger protein